MEPTTYREPARDRPVARIDVLFGEGASLGTAQEVAVLSSLAAMASTGALAVGHSDLLALAKHFVRSSAARWKKDVLAQFFECDEVMEEPGAWTSPDRRRRLRVVPGDALARWEELDPGTGETLITVRGPAPLVPPAPREPQVIERRAAHVHGRARQPRCFAGVPHALGGKPVATSDASLVLLEVRADGVLLERRDATSSVGDTFHPDAEAALRQIASECGDRVGAWHDASTDILIIEPARAGWERFARSKLTF